MTTNKAFITKDDYLMGRDKLSPLSPEMVQKMHILLERVNKLLSLYGNEVKVSSGYRPAQINQSIGGAKQSAHMTCEAIDLVDPNAHLCNWILNNLHLLKQLGLFTENPVFTKGWVHLQIRPTKSGNLVFLP